jgi:hypothetical protein
MRLYRSGPEGKVGALFPLSSIQNNNTHHHPPRPSNSRINHLKEENARLSRLAEKMRPALGAGETSTQNEPPQVISLASPSPSLSHDESSLSEQRIDSPLHQSTWTPTNPTSTDVDIAESQGTPFHGPPSALFDGGHQRKRQKPTTINAARDTPPETQLLAEATKQRKLSLVMSGSHLSSS